MGSPSKESHAATVAIPSKASTETKAIPPFTAMNWTIQEIRESIPAEFFHRSTFVAFLYLIQDMVMAAGLFYVGIHIDPFFDRFAVKLGGMTTTNELYVEIGRWSMWSLYWWFQGLVFTGLWTLGHECGHGAFSPNKVVCDSLGFVLHSFLWTPYFSWSIVHHRHHANHNSMDRDEVYVPKTRSDLGIPMAETNEIKWHEYFEDTPIYTLFMLLRQQFLAFPAYLLYNVSGQKSYPKFTSHFDPNAVMFRQSQRHLVLLSNLGLILTGLGVWAACQRWGGASILKLYGIPWLLVSHWFIMITYLHHTDPAIPHYRGEAWNYQRGASSTVDRDFLGWQGKFFLHGVAHYHVIHHFFPKMPHYHASKATKYLKAFLGEHYHYSDKPVFEALWHNYNECQFVEDEGGVLFYRNKEGKAVAVPATCS